MSLIFKAQPLTRGALASILCALLLCATATTPQAQQKATLTVEESAALERISADSLRGHLSFIASDALEGRNTPSRGLDIAAEYIAAQFRRAGLEPIGDDGYFQTARWSQSARDMKKLELKFASAGAGELKFGAEQSALGMSVMGRTLWSPEGALALSKAGVVKVDYKDAAAISALKPEDVAGKVVLTEISDFRREDRALWRELYGAQDAFIQKMSALGASLVVSADPARKQAGRSDTSAPRLVDPENKAARAASSGVGDAHPSSAPLVNIYGAEAAKLYDELKTGATGATLSVNAPAPSESAVTIRNVAGVLRGSDPTLKDTYVIVSAHYDHLGVREGEGDRIFNGANDDGSGTVSVIELAAALATLKVRPKRSVLFMTFFGEEKGLLGSRYYGRHPLVPLRQTVAQINLEQIGRTDDSEGAQVGTMSVTGFDYSDVGAALAEAGALTGIKVYKHPQNSDAFFGRSDNQALADVGIPAHTLSVAFEFPDYHAVGDEWPKVDYANMSRVLRMVGAGVLLITDNPRAPQWNESNPKTARYVQAWKELHAK